MKRMQGFRKGIGLGSVLARGAVLLLLASALDARAAGISLVPATASPSVGSSFALDLVISGLGAGAPPSLGAFDVVVAYDAGAITFSGATFGTLLGSVPGEASTDVVPVSGSAELAQVSLLAPAALDGLQPASFTLATLSFVATSATPSTISIDSALLSDSLGSSLELTALTGARITPVAPSAVPEPGAFLLYGAGLVLVARVRRAPARPLSRRLG
jgi:hypothetical protein